MNGFFCNRDNLMSCPQQPDVMPFDSITAAADCTIVAADCTTAIADCEIAAADCTLRAGRQQVLNLMQTTLSLLRSSLLWAQPMACMSQKYTLFYEMRIT